MEVGVTKQRLLMEIGKWKWEKMSKKRLLEVVIYVILRLVLTKCYHHYQNSYSYENN